MNNADGREDGYEKAQNHMSLCRFYVALFRNCETDDVLTIEDKAVHDTTQELTDNLDEQIGFPLKGRPDYDNLAPMFFRKFHEIAMITLQERYES
jgi:hypothetical protein